MSFKDANDYDPHLHRILPHPTNNFETLVHLLKGSLGTGILAMPQAFSRVGMVLGCIATMVLGVILTHCLHVLKLSPVSAVSNVVTVISVIIIIYCLIAYQKSYDELSTFGQVDEYPLFFGTTMFALTSVGVVVSAESNMKTPKSFGKLIGVLNISMAIVVIMYTVVGALGYSYCVSECSDSITLDLPHGGEAIAVLALYIIAILTSYALQCYVPVEIIWRDYLLPKLEKKNASKTRRNAIEYSVRIGLCIGTFLITLAVPRLGLFISLFGALCLAALGISFPALMEICCYYPNNYGPYKMRLVKDIFLIFVGVVGLVTGTYTAIYSIIISFM